MSKEKNYNYPEKTRITSIFLTAIQYTLKSDQEAHRPVEYCAIIYIDDFALFQSKKTLLETSL